VAVWTPASLGASLLAWWSADRADLITLSGAQVTSWRDSVAAYNAAQAVSGARPVYSATGWAGLYPGITFDGVDDELTLASQPFPAVANPSEIWALPDQTSLVADTTNRFIFSYGGSLFNDQRRLFRTVVTAQNRVAASTGLGGSGINLDYAADFSGRHVARAVITATTLAVGMDGAMGTPSAAVSATGAVRTRIGATAGTTAAGFYKGVIRDVIVTGALTSDQAALLTTYLMNRRNP
jgi:hypothetical protein